MQDGKCVDPDPPAAVLELDGVVQQHAEQRHHHLGHLVLVRVLRVHVRHREQPVLPHRHLQHRPAIQSQEMWGVVGSTVLKYTGRNRDRFIQHGHNALGTKILSNLSHIISGFLCLSPIINLHKIIIYTNGAFK